MDETITGVLAEIEQQHGVTMLYACESGSRAWGFPSEDSDYDVRFIYVRPRDWYLSIDTGRDVIELPIESELDVRGWDIRKTLGLLRKSNCSLLEWLSSPKVYLRREDLAAPLQSMMDEGFVLAKSSRHYLSMAKTNLEKTKNEQVRIKSYLYALRPILCCRWILDRRERPPVLFQHLVDAYLQNTEVGDVMDRLLDHKRGTNESDTVPQQPALDAYLATEYATLKDRIPDDGPPAPISRFDETFREILDIADQSRPCGK